MIIDRHKKIFKEFKMNNLSDYHDLYVQSDTLLLADIFENFRNECFEIYELDRAHFLSAPGLAWLACLNKAEVRLELLTDIDMLSMVEKGIRGGILHVIHRYTQADNKYAKIIIKQRIIIIEYLDANNLYGWAMSQKLPVNGFKWKTNISIFDEKFIRNYDEDSNKGYILEIYVEYLKDLHDLHSELPFLPEIMKVNKCNKFVCNLYDKNNNVVHIRVLK